jgi:hypothetical protein
MKCDICLKTVINSVSEIDPYGNYYCDECMEDRFICSECKRVHHVLDMASNRVCLECEDN